MLHYRRLRIRRNPEVGIRFLYPTRTATRVFISLVLVRVSHSIRRRPAADESETLTGDHEGESSEERLLQRTGWFNAMVREHPKDVQLWLRFAAFQLEFLPMQRRPNLLPVLEKQSAILSRALSTCGDNVILIDRYMAVAEARYDTDATISLWSSVSGKEQQRVV